VNLWRNASWKRRISVVAAGSTLLAVAGAGIGYAVTDIPEPNSFAKEQAMRLLWNDGSQMARFGKNRILVPLDKVSPAAQKAILAAEDRNFYTEPGISPKGMFRALFSNVRAGGVSQGGSTITQQYAKNAFLTQDRTFSRKIKEIFIAVKMSRTVSKEQVLEDYLNTIYFGRGAFGIETASLTYFNVHAAALTPSQAAVLASSIRSPAGYDPARHPERAKQRWDYVLDGMVGKGWLTEEERAAARYPKVLKVSTGSNLPGDLDHVHDQVVEDLLRHGFTEDRLAAGGLTVTTTLDAAAQTAAREAVEDLVPDQREGKDDPVAALVSVEPGTGRVIAYYGGRTAGGLDFADNDVYKGVQPGSAMKPYVLAAALEKGKVLTDRYDGKSPQEVCGQKVHNDAGDPPFGKIDLVTAMQYSANTVYTRVACETGPREVSALAHAAGIAEDHELDGDTGRPTQQIALGSGGYELHPLDQAVGYATFAAEGEHADPYFVQRVADRHGNVVYQAEPESDRAFSADVAADVTYALQAVVRAGTGTRAKIPGRPTAGKTGTTTNNTNAWFVGYTPQLSTAVWVGRPSGKALKGVLGISGGVYGGNVPARIFRTFMRDALEGEPVKPFPVRANVGPTPSPTPTPTATPTPSATPSATATPTPSATPMDVLPTLLPPSPTDSPSPTPTPTASP
jgi:membrane peptidoglycan carboxypeptidase